MVVLEMKKKVEHRRKRRYLLFHKGLYQGSEIGGLKGFAPSRASI